MTGLFALLLAALLPRSSVTEIPDSVRTEDVTTVADARERLIANRGARIFFRLRGTIVAGRSQDLASFILLDQTQATHVICSSDDTWRLGDEVEVICTAMQPKYENPVLYSESLELTVLRHGERPVPARVRPIDLAGHRQDFKIVELEGIVTDAFPDDTNHEWTIFILEYADAKTMVWTNATRLGGRRPEDFLDAEVRLTGIVHPSISNFRRSPGPWLLMLDPDTFEQMSPPPERPFAARLPTPHRQVVSGTVLAVWQESKFLLNTANGRRIRVRLADGAPQPKPGDRVTVSGFAHSNEFCTRLSNALLRIDATEAAADETPVETRASAILRNPTGKRLINTQLNGRTVRLTGIVRDGRAAGTPNAELTLSDGTTTFTALIGEAAAPAIGSRVAVVGICLINDVTDPSTGIVKLDSLAIALRRAADLHVLASPPWWTPVRLIALVALLAVLIVTVLVWNAALRTLVLRRSRELARETIRSASTNLRLEERTRLAVELHDTIAQNLTGASFEIKTVTRLAETNREKMLEHLKIVDRTLKSCRDDIRNCIWDLRTNLLEAHDLDQVLHLALAPHIGDAALKVRFHVPRARLSEPTLHALMRMLRELAVNAVRHGQATQVKVAGNVENGDLVFSVRDNGKGFDPDQAPGPAQGHFGIQGIRERLRRLNGTIHFDSSPGHGTRVVVRIGLPRISEI